jgi:hypothetical protein
MRITTVVELGDGDSFAYTPDAAATQVLAALGGNPTNDYAIVTVTMPPTHGEAGVQSPLPEEPPPPPPE